MVISIALLGFGASGTFLYIYQKRLLAQYQTYFPLLLFTTGILMSVVIRVTNLEPIRFDSYLLFNSTTHIWRLLITYLLFFLPFFTGALAIGLTFVKYSEQIGKIYFFNLAGSGIGGILVLILMWYIIPSRLSSVIAVIPVIAGIVVWPRNSSVPLKAIALLSIITIPLTYIYPSQLTPSEYKSISKTLLLPKAKTEHQSSSPYGLIEIISSPAIRYAPGTSLLYPQSAPIVKSAFNNGNYAGSILPTPKKDELFVLNYTTMALPYKIKDNRKALIINSGTGEQIALAIANNTKKITAVEPNRMLTSILKQESTSVNVINREARSFLRSDTSLYNLVILPTVGSFHGTSGLNAMQAQYNLTLQSFNDIWKKLSNNGLISISCWMDYPIKDPLKIAATLTELLEKNGIYKPENHISAIRSWNTITFTIKKNPLTKTETQKIRAYCKTMLFDPLMLPDITNNERQHYNKLTDYSLFENIDKINTPARKELYRTYPFRIKPATDNRPYFSQYLRWNSLSRLSKLFGERAIPFLELGYIIVILTLIQVTIIAALLILLPLLLKKRNTTNKTGTLLYFGSIGLGYMFIEIVLIQQFTLYFGHPIYSVVAIISTLLLTSGAGSYYSEHIKKRKNRLWIYIAAISAIIIIYSAILTPLLQTTTALPPTLKTVIMLITVGIPGFLMGIPFPTGITLISKKTKTEIPWAWATNGYLSVISAPLALIISAEAGFTFVLLAASVLYSITAVMYYTKNMK
jgi:hypothetical protein